MKNGKCKMENFLNPKIALSFALLALCFIKGCK
jgi:hypothetical protein